MKLIELVDRRDRTAADAGIDALGIRDEQHRLAARPELDALVSRGKKPAAPA
jgi:hypothetical protein